MALDRKTVLVCSCEASMPLDECALARACQGAALSSHRQLCRAELARFQKARLLAGETGRVLRHRSSRDVQPANRAGSDGEADPDERGHDDRVNRDTRQQRGSARLPIGGVQGATTME